MSDKPQITICMGSSCFAGGNEKNLAVCEKFLFLEVMACPGGCQNGPCSLVK